MKNAKKFMVVIAGMVVFTCLADVLAQDWPQWRGPGRDGKLTGFLESQSWPKTLTQKWTVTIGSGDSSPVLADGKLYTFSRQDPNEVLYCMDPASGKILWADHYPAQFAASGPSARHPGTRSTPVVADSKICTLGIGGILSCLDADSGAVLWRKQSAADYLDTPYQFESSMSPLVVDGLCIVYIGGDGQGALVAFDLAIGQAKWKYAGDAPSPSSPVIMTVDGVRQIVTMSETAVIGVSLSDQTLLWSVPFKSRPVNSTTPVIDGQTVYVTGNNMGLMALKISQSDGKFTAETLWTNTDAAAGSRYTTPIARDGRLFGYASNNLACYNAKSGEILWTDTASRGQTAAILDAGSCLVAMAINGELIFYRPDEKQYTELAVYKVSDTEVWAHPILDGSRIFIRDKESIALWTMDKTSRP